MVTVLGIEKEAKFKEDEAHYELIVKSGKISGPAHDAFYARIGAGRVLGRSLFGELARFF